MIVNRMTKVCILIVFIMTCSVVVYGYDTPSDWAVKEIENARENNLVINEADQQFRNQVTREVFCKLIINMVEQNLGEAIEITIVNPFKDTNEIEIIKAYQLGIVSGISEDSFAPNALVTREQVATMMMRTARKLDELTGKSFINLDTVSTSTFADESDVSSWALEDIKQANELGIMYGVGDNRINPKGNSTVEQSIILMNRYTNELKQIEETIEIETEPLIVTNEPPTPNADPVILADLMEQTEGIYNPHFFVTDPEGDPLTITKINGSTTDKSLLYGTVSLMANDYIKYVSNDIDQEQSDNFTVTVSDSVNEVDVNVRVDLLLNTHVNSDPVAIAEPLIMPDILEGHLYTYEASSIATDADGDQLIIASVNGGAGTFPSEHGTIETSNSGSFTYQSGNITQQETEAFIITLIDGNGGVLYVNATVSIVPLSGSSPEPLEDLVEFTVNENETIYIDADDLAEDNDGDPLTITGTSPFMTSLGSVAISQDGYRLAYHAADFDQNTSFELLINVTDGTTTIPVNAKLNVMEVGNHAPEAKRPVETTYDIDEGEALILSGNDIANDEDNEELVIIGLARNSRSSGTGNINVNKEFQFRSDNITTDKTMKYTLTVSDGTDTCEIPVIINISQNPELVYVYEGEFGPNYNVGYTRFYADKITDSLEGADYELVSISTLDGSQIADSKNEHLTVSPTGNVYFKLDEHIRKGEYYIVYEPYPNDLEPGTEVEIFNAKVTNGTNTYDVKVLIRVIRAQTPGSK